MKYKLISFDLDGTLVNTLPSLAYVGNLWLQLSLIHISEPTRQVR